MKHTARLLLIGLFCLAGACKQHTIIPDDELALIFHDAFLVNAYRMQPAQPDSLNIYEPIFAKYGYTTEDVQYTIGNFSKRKSARLGDVVEKVIEQLEKEGLYYNREIAVLDTIDRVAERTFSRRILADSALRIRTLKDTSKVSYTFEVQPGTYRVEFDYRVDSADRNNLIRSMMWLEQQDSTRTGIYTLTLRRHRDEHFTHSFQADTTHRRLRLHLYTPGKQPLQPATTFQEIRVHYTPLTASAVDSLYERQLNIRIFAEEFFAMPATKEESNEESAAGEESQEKEL